MGPDRWRVRISMGFDSNGKRQQFTKVVQGTKKDAEKFLTEKLRELDTRTPGQAIEGPPPDAEGVP